MRRRVRTSSEQRQAPPVPASLADLQLVEPAELVIGEPAHRPIVFIQLRRGSLFFVAACGERGESHDLPGLLIRGQVTCPLCFIDF